MSRRDAAGCASSSCRPPRLLELGVRGMSPARRGVWKRCVGAGGTGWGRCAAAAGVLGVAGGLGLRALGVRRPSSLWMPGRAGTCRGGTLPAAPARAAGRRGSWSRGPEPFPRHGPQRGPRGQQPRARGAADGWKLSKGGRARRRRHGRAPPWGRCLGRRPAGDVSWRGSQLPAPRCELAVPRRQRHPPRADGPARIVRAGPPGGVGARGPGGQRRGRRSATTPPRGRGNQAVAGASAVPRVLARSTAEPSRTLADSGDCISGTARNRRPTPSYSASIVGS